MELLLLDRSGTLPLNALPDCQTLDTLSAALSPSNACRGLYATQDTATVGFITAGRNTTMPDRDAELSWVAFRQKAQQAAELSLPKPIAQGLMGAMTEIEDNIHLHSGRPDTGMVAFRGSADEPCRKVVTRCHQGQRHVFTVVAQLSRFSSQFQPPR
jgi:hypothetical protein